MYVIALQPDYYDNFKCIAQNCQISCCNYNWSILIDKETYQKYKKFNSLGKEVNSDYTRLVRLSVDINKNSTNSTNYGKIKHMKDEKAFILGSDAYRATECSCPFSTNNKLCDLQSKFGEDMLSQTCKTFPRTLNYVFKDYEQTLTTQCEAVCSLLYSIEEPLRFRKHKVTIDIKNPVTKTLKEEMKNNDEILSHFDIVRATCVKILQSREFSLDNRVILLGLYISKLSSMKGDNFKKIPSYSKAFLQSQKDYLQYFDIKIKSDEKKEKHFYPHKILLDAVNFDKIELGYEEKRLLIKISDNIKVYYKNYNLISKKSQKMLNESSHYIENIFVNLIIEKLFPFNLDYDVSSTFVKRVDLMNNYIIFAWSYVSYKVMVTGAVTLEEELDLDILYKTTVLHNREVISSTKMLNEMCEILKKFGFSSISQMAILIKES